MIPLSILIVLYPAGDMDKPLVNLVSWMAAMLMLLSYINFVTSVILFLRLLELNHRTRNESRSFMKTLNGGQQKEVDGELIIRILL